MKFMKIRLAIAVGVFIHTIIATTFTKGEVPSEKSENLIVLSKEDFKYLIEMPAGKSEEPKENIAAANPAEKKDGENKDGEKKDGEKKDEDDKNTGVKYYDYAEFGINLGVSNSELVNSRNDKGNILKIFVDKVTITEQCTFKLHFLKDGKTQEDCLKNANESNGHTIIGEIDLDKATEFLNSAKSSEESVSAVTLKLRIKHSDLEELKKKYEAKSIGKEYYIHATNINTPQAANKNDPIQMKSCIGGLYSSMYTTEDIINEIKSKDSEEEGFFAANWKGILIGSVVVIGICVIVGVFVSRNK
ncbi:hypothetical protein NEPAR06_1076 [Nematocida parisii]|uniref:Uncharacterized protein n=1 Tax=Nematocida parisii (strain ERTm3) TaxID=935791 RepID=I3EGE3_NEMP3|nr:uncharacterized protein NEPG_01216 [Nematocida parisii ERTm1]EIJ88290.1 hypothetical protein NEQG_01734 [Nematocida parisii ERTm3]KAI5125419.1 hypothetical protein NEPAR03_0094 [Nematocida parisii]EIJ93644.1 hypothetical protein NEPG_01216 [Nematocida parisii ERTm1]KAI5125543.1 hypothetical protein NEPAR08_0094 [Nematocida parisii]KAI5141836.1 hypothetical protein NEPAR04_1223 [Nematocida parisii]|eukprot:XP_013059044.1 hypothetical protein NEPG_01216 [Nematocida parisii ERTm1]